MAMLSAVFLTQAGLVIGFAGAILLIFSNKTGVISKSGSVIFNGLDPMNPSEDNERSVRASRWRNSHFIPIGVSMLAISFLLQFIATLR